MGVLRHIWDLSRILQIGDIVAADGFYPKKTAPPPAHLIWIVYILAHSETHLLLCQFWTPFYLANPSRVRKRYLMCHKNPPHQTKWEYLIYLTAWCQVLSQGIDQIWLLFHAQNIFWLQFKNLMTTFRSDTKLCEDGTHIAVIRGPSFRDRIVWCFYFWFYNFATVSDNSVHYHV